MSKEVEIAINYLKQHGHISKEFCFDKHVLVEMRCSSSSYSEVDSDLYLCLTVLKNKGLIETFYPFDIKGRPHIFAGLSYYKKPRGSFLFDKKEE